MRPWLFVGMVSASAGCSPWSDLPDVPIEGGTAAQRLAVRAELVDFHQWIGSGRVRVRKIELAPVQSPFAGHFHPDGSITLDEDLEVDFFLRWAARHELCHALDAAEEVSGESIPALDQLAAALELADDYEQDRDDASWRREAFAYSCDLAPFTTHLLATSCPDDEDPAMPDLAAWLLDGVWTHADLPPPTPLGAPVVFEPPESVSVLGVPWTGGTVEATTDPGLVRVSVADGEGAGARWVVERETGQVVDREVEVVPLESIHFSPVPPPPGAIIYDTNAWGSGALVVAYLTAEVSALGSAGDRLVWLDPSTWSWKSVGDGCVTAPDGRRRDLFLADGRAWVAWFEEGRVAWAPIGATPDEPSER